MAAASPRWEEHFATAVMCGDVSDSIWGSPVPPCRGCRQALLSQAVPASTLRCWAVGRKQGVFFLSLHNCYFLSSRKAVSFSASAPSACCGRRRQIPAAVGLGSCSASQPGPNARVPLAKKGFARQTWICLAGAGGGLFPTQLRGCGVGSGCKWPVCLSVSLRQAQSRSG